MFRVPGSGFREKSQAFGLVLLGTRNSELGTHFYFGFVTFGEQEQQQLKDWLSKQVSKRLSTSELMDLAKEVLLQWKVIPPKQSVLRRLTAGVNNNQVQEEWLEQIATSLDPALIEEFDKLLQVPTEQRTSPLHELKKHPPEGKPPAILEHIDRFKKLEELGVTELVIAGFDEVILEHLAQQTSRYDAEDLKRFRRTKRHAMLACFLTETVKTVLDQLVEMHDQCVVTVLRRSRNAFEKRRDEERRKAKQGLDTVLTTMEGFLSHRQEQSVWVKLFEQQNWEELEQATQTCRNLQRIEEFGFFDELRTRQSYLKQYLPAFLSLPFEGETGTKQLLTAIQIFRQLASGEIKQLPSHTPVEIGPGAWAKGIKRSNGTIDKRIWEVALAVAVRDALRSGDLFLPQSRHHVSFWNLVYSDSRWKEEREQAYKVLSLSTDGNTATSALREQFSEVATQTQNGLPTNKFAQVSAGKLKLKKRDSLQESSRTKQLRRTIGTHMPRVRIETLLAEVDSWCGFTREFRPLGTRKSQAKQPYSALLATLVAHGTNLGVAAMGDSTEEITVDMLSHVTRWLLRPNTLKAANKTLVDFHHSLPLSSSWGTGQASSSDGQRFGIQAKSLLASFYPRYFGYYDRAITIYTHVSDQYSVFASKAISCSPREAIYVLDGLLENDTVLQPKEHYTDTHGYTEHLFGLCYLLGFSFMPRLRDLKDQQLYRIDRESDYGALNPLFRGYANIALIEEQWDQLVRVAASLRNRTAPAHVVLQRLATSSPSDRVSKALTELGRIVKTIYILRYIHDEEIRRRVHLQLNRGEARHDLAKRLFFANQGYFREGALPEIMNKVSALSLLSNASLVWNTVRMSQIVNRLRDSGHEVTSEELARISPLARKHITPNGAYIFAPERIENKDLIVPYSKFLHVRGCYPVLKKKQHLSVQTCFRNDFYVRFIQEVDGRVRLQYLS